MIRTIKDIFLSMADFFEYVKNYKNNTEEMENLDRDLDNLKIRYGVKKKEIDDLNKTKEYLENRQDECIATIKEQRKQIRELKKQNKFLMKRENKLQQIEAMFENKRVVLKDLKELVKGDEQ